MRTRLAFAIVSLLAVSAMAGCGSDTASTTTGTSSTAAAPGTGTVPGTTPPDDLTGTTWQLAAFSGPNGTAVPAAPAAPATLTFEPDGALTGSTGCNRFAGRYTRSGSELSIELGPMTQAGCTSAALTVQEAAILQLLPETATYAVDADGLTLAGADDVTLLDYEPGLVGLTDTSWNVTGVNNGTGGVETSVATESLSAAFGPAGTFSGNGGCNELNGAYETTGSDGLTITGVTSTQKACASEVDALESRYIAALGQVTTYEISGDQLTLRDAAGATQVTLQLEA